MKYTALRIFRKIISRNIINIVIWIINIKDDFFTGIWSGSSYEFQSVKTTYIYLNVTLTFNERSEIISNIIKIMKYYIEN